MLKRIKLTLTPLGVVGKLVDKRRGLLGRRGLGESRGLDKN